MKHHKNSAGYARKDRIIVEDYAGKLAEVIVGYSTEVRAGDFVGIIGEEPAQELIEALYAAVIERGGHPTVRIENTALTEYKLGLGSREQAEFSDPVDELLYGETDVLLRVSAPRHSQPYAAIEADRLAQYNRGLGPRLHMLMDRIGEGAVRYCMVAWPSDGIAQQTGMGTHAYEDMLYRASGLHQKDPVAYWEEVATSQNALVAWLEGRSRVHVQGPDIDLTFSVEGRRWVSAHGKLNFPDGEIFTGPVEDSVEGSVQFNLPSLSYGQEVRGAKLHFKAGTVVEASAEMGQDFLRHQLSLDHGAGRLGEFAIGTNPGVTRLTGSTLLDEKIGGTIHMALGRSISETGGVNESQIHWDLVHDMKSGGTINVDDELFYRNGEFVVE
ncbi:MAG: aminopeptidase [Anaerolineales bacterium]